MNHKVDWLPTGATIQGEKQETVNESTNVLSVHHAPGGHANDHHNEHKFKVCHPQIQLVTDASSDDDSSGRTEEQTVPFRRQSAA